MLGNTHQPNAVKVLERLSKLTYIEKMQKLILNKFIFFILPKYIDFPITIKNRFDFDII